MNIIFTFSGIIVNTLVIVSICKSSQLRKKLCHFMVMVLSCFDLISVVTNHPVILVLIISWLRKDYHLRRSVSIYVYIFNAFHFFSPVVLLVINIERYLGAYYPIFHRTLVTRRRLLILLAIFLIFTTVMYTRYRNGLLAISGPVNLLILLVFFPPPFAFVNFKLFIIARKVHRERAVSPEKRRRKSLKNISTALWITACLMLLYIPTSLNSAFILAHKPANATNFVFHLGTHMCHHELHIEQFDIFLKEQSFTRGGNKDTKNIEISSCRILSKNFIFIYLV